MTTAYPNRWRDQPRRPTPSSTAVDHPQLTEWELEEEASRAPMDVCECFDAVSMEYGPNAPCDVCKASFLSEVDDGGLVDDKREPGRVA